MTETTTLSNFIRTIIDKDNETGKYDGRVHTRFPPEPNGYLHIGHAKAILLNYGLAEDYGGQFNLRFDDTNPTKEEQEFIDAIKEDMLWLGADWEDRLYYASDYYEQLYQWAEQLIQDGKAYVDDLSADEIREYRGTLTEPGTNSPYRERTIEENLDLFRRMRACEFPEGSRVLRAKIDMASPFFVLRDPVMYRILLEPHPRTGSEWCIYPTYDWAHGQSDSLEGITHSICTLEFENNRRLYDWFQDALDIPRSQQIEWAGLALNYTITSKRKLRRLVEDGYVSGWDDPRMPTVRALRRRGYTADALRKFGEMTGVSKANSTVDFALLEHFIREDLNAHSPRVMAVLEPLKVIIDNYPEGEEESFDVPYHPQDKENNEARSMPFAGELYIERDDFRAEPTPGFRRLIPGREVRLMNAYFITCTDVVTDKDGQVVEIHAIYDPETKGGQSPDGRKVKGTIHWVSATHAVDAEVRLYDQLFAVEDPEDVPEGGDFVDNLNPDSLVVVEAKVEPSLKSAEPGDRFQFVRNGYFVVDTVDSTADHLVFNRTVSLRESKGKKEQERK